MLVIGKPETVIGRHRKRFWLCSTWKSRRHRGGRPSMPRDVRARIGPMSRENPLWGAPRNHQRTPPPARGGDGSRSHDVALDARVLKIAIGRYGCPVRALPFARGRENRASRPAISPLRARCLDISPPPPGGDDVTSHLDRPSSGDPKIAPRSWRTADCSSDRCSTDDLVASKGSCRDTAL